MEGNIPATLKNLQGKFTKKELDYITSLQRKRQEDFRNTSQKGERVAYQGYSFLILPDTFWPFEDSKALAQNFEINDDERVLDVGTGSGLLVILAAYKGAGKVVALEINPAAIKTAEANTRLHGFDNKIEVRKSDVFSALKQDEQFDVIITNPPFRNMPAKDFVEAASWDTNFSFHRDFFKNVGKFLAPNGRIYLAQVNHGPLEEVERLLTENNLRWKLIGRHKMPDDSGREFFAFEIKPLKY